MNSFLLLRVINPAKSALVGLLLRQRPSAPDPQATHRPPERTASPVGVRGKAGERMIRNVAKPSLNAHLPKTDGARVSLVSNFAASRSMTRILITRHAAVTS